MKSFSGFFLIAISLCMAFLIMSCSNNHSDDTILANDDDDLINVEHVGDADEPINLLLRQAERINADNRFAFTLFKELSESHGENIFFSPLSLNMAFGLLYNGASGATRAEMAEVLGFSDFSETEINTYYKKMSQALLTIDPLTDLGIAHSIWYRDLEGFSVKPPFIEVNKTFFDATIQSLDFCRPDAPGIINNWCAEKTKGKITSIIEDKIADDVMMYLLNALYFKGEWVNAFDKRFTSQEDFTKTDHQKVKADIMSQVALFPYYANQYLQCVELAYGNEAFSMVMILPGNDMDIEQLIAHLDNAVWENAIENLQTRELLLTLPKFKVECTLTLNDPLKNVGILRIFSGGFANISNDSLFISNYLQKTFIEVDEEGTEAAAVTVIEAATGQSSYTLFFANRPFLYLIKEKSTGIILFIGRMDNP